MFYGTPPIVTNGLVLNLDCGNRLSYPTSGTTWTDLSGNNNNGTLTNGPTFNPNNLGSIVFDGVDDYVSVGDDVMPYSGITYPNIDFKTYNGETLPITDGLELWLDGSDNTTFTIIDDVNVSQWRDKSGNNRHATQSSTELQPKRYGTKNGYGAVYFSGNTMKTDNFFNYIEYTKIAVHIHRNNKTGFSGNIISSENGNHATWYNIGPYFSTFHGGLVASASTSTLNVWNSSLAEFSGTSGNLQSNIYINDVFNGSGTTSTNATPNSNVQLGGYSTNGNFLDGAIAEVLIYSRVLTQMEKTDVFNYLNNKWGITTNSPEIIYTGTNNFTGYTKMVWFNPKSYLTNNNLISGSENGGRHAFWMAGGTKLNSGHNGIWNRVTSLTTIDLNKWWHGAVTFSPINGWCLYVNGELESTNNNTDIYTNGEELEIGSYDSNNFFNGDISVVQLYDRVLSPQEVLQNYNAYKTRFGLT
jgi:hypothetical protein